MRNPLSIRKTLRGRASRSSRVGFTLVELMIVVSIIGITAAMATPSLMRVVQDRRTQKDAVDLLTFLQEARGRSVARGGAVRITFNAGQYTMDEAMVDINTDGTPDVPLGRCGGAGVIWQPIASRGSSTRSQATVNTDVHTGAPTTLPNLQVCFTPRGRMLSWDGAAWVAVNQVFSYRFEVRDGGGVVASAKDRWVHLAPNGIARMEL